MRLQSKYLALKSRTLGKGYLANATTAGVGVSGKVPGAMLFINSAEVLKCFHKCRLKPDEWIIVEVSVYLEVEREL